MTERKSWALLLFLLIALAIAGCGEKVPPEQQEYAVTMFYANQEYVDTGKEELPPMKAVENYHLYCAEGEQYEALLMLLRSVPEDLEGADTMLTDRIEILSVKVEAGTAVVDFAGEGLSGGSLEEGILLSQIVDSLIKSFDEIEQVQFLVDGEAAESLMGHYDLSEPFTKGIYSN